MNKQVENKTSNCPYRDLYIYYIEGSVITDNLRGTFLGNWEEEGFSFVFFSEKATEIIKTILEIQPELTLIDEFVMTYEEWLGEKPESRSLGNFIVSPPWDVPDTMFLPNFGALHIVLDPGVVFGTGTHPTTHDCLDILESVVKDNQIQTVLDLGTGTGLLAIAAGKLKCKKILAVDFNHLAVKTTQRNITLNNLNDKIIAVQGLAEDFVDTPGDLLIANIHYDVMKDVIASPGFLEKKYFILSGLLRSQASLVEETLRQLPVEIIEKRSQNSVWYTFYGRTG